MGARGADLLARPARESNGVHVVGALFLLGALLAATSLLLPHPASGELAIWAVTATGVVVGGLLLTRAGWVTTGKLQLAVAFGSLLINVMILASGVATGVYAAMFCWVVLISVNFFSLRHAIGQFAWMMGGYAAVLTAVESGGGYSALTRWLFATMALAVTGAATAWLVFPRRLAEQETRGFLALSKEMLCTIDAEDRFEKLNPAWERILGHPPERLHEAPMIDVIHPLERAEASAAIDRLRDGTDELTLENRCRDAAGGWRPMRWELTFSSEDAVIYARVRPVRGAPEAARAVTRGVA